MNWIDTLKQLLELGWPALVTVAVYFIARQYMMTVENEIAFLRTQVEKLQAEIIEVKHQLLEEQEKQNNR
jgi:Tfp pilus assembly protein PilN